MPVNPQLDLLGDAEKPSRPDWVEQLRAGVRRAAQQGIYFGTSSWKYEGWLGQIYARARYETRGRFSLARFERECLREYAEIFPHVCGDFAFYTFYSADYWTRLFAQVPPTFLFTFKVPEFITCAVFPMHDRYGARAGQPNESFLDADLLQREFLDRLAPHAKQVGMLVFEFPESTVRAKEDPTAFLERLDKFLARLPDTFRYGVEIRSKRLLGENYFGCLRQHRVAHVFNSWTRMPTIGEQLAMKGAFTSDVAMARVLLRPGRTYEKAVAAFQPYTEIRDPYPEGRADILKLIKTTVGAQSVAPAARGAKSKQASAAPIQVSGLIPHPSPRRLFVAINNRYEGSAPQSISAILLQMSEE
jgi:uncharacterized protein YecE (DUF72 family)